MCRPARLTCRWIREISESVALVCPAAASSLSLPRSCTPDSTEQVWQHYWQQLNQTTQCIREPVVQQILRFEIDYNEIRNKP